jgi:hypothetical protein
MMAGEGHCRKNFAVTWVNFDLVVKQKIVGKTEGGWSMVMTHSDMGIMKDLKGARKYISDEI